MTNGISLSWAATVTRRVGGIRTVSAGAVNRQILQEEFRVRCRHYQREAALRCVAMPPVVDGLWKTEGLATTFGKYRMDGNTLQDASLIREVMGIVHVGYGAATTELVHFDAERLRETFADRCDPLYVPCAIEGIGSILRIYERRAFRKMCGLLGLIPRSAPPGPEAEGFFARFLGAFSEDEQRLITHGYGRLLAFSHFGLAPALAEAQKLPEGRVAPCVQGVAFAFAMMNSSDMGSILAESALAGPEPVRRAFQKGLVYALVFCEWFTPGFLEAWRPVSSLEEKLVSRARREAGRNLRRGWLMAFQLEEDPQ